MNSMTENPLRTEKISKLLRAFAVSSITATLVGLLFMAFSDGQTGKILFSDKIPG